MLEIKVSEWTANLLKTTVADKIRSQMPKQQEAPIAQPSGFVNMFVSYFTEQSPKENAQAVDHPHLVIVSEIVRKLGLQNHNENILPSILEQFNAGQLVQLCFAYVKEFPTRTGRIDCIDLIA